MNLVPALTWMLEGDSTEALDPRLLPLLHAIASSGSLASAVTSCGISYRAAWGVLRTYQRLLATPLVLLERGRGARLTSSGQTLIEAERAATRRLARKLSELRVEIGPERRTESPDAQLNLRVAASHDLAMVALSGTLASASHLSLEVSYMGSLHAIGEFVEGRADIAGFHVPIGGRTALDRSSFLRGLKTRADRLIRFVDRDVGLILARGNPSHVRSLHDVAANGLRFVNRQRGSGTRLLIDQMIADEGIDPRNLDGHQREEFTHSAVAATVASGGADAGIGLRAAATEYGLAFVPLVQERYFLAVRAKELRSPAIVRLLQLLRSPAFAKLSRSLPGYRFEGAGTVVTLGALAATGPVRNIRSRNS